MSEAAARRVLAGRYEIVGVLGRGGMGTVYRGRDLELGRPVAIKLLEARLSTEAAALARFRREARAAARLTHPNVVTVYDSGVDHGDHYIVMELVAGGTLSELLQERGQLPLPLALAIGADVLRALGAAHEAGLVHRDVSPGNVMITRDGAAKVTDFGIARAFGPDAEQTGSIAGTAAYLAPEQADGQPVTPAADLYGAGCVLYAMLIGQPPFGAGNAVAVAAKHRDERPAAPSALRAGLPPAVDALVLRALEKRPEDRFASAQAMRRAVEGTGVPLPGPGARDAWPAAEVGTPGPDQTGATGVASLEDRRGSTAVWPGAVAGRAGADAARGEAVAAGAGAAAGFGAAAAPRPRTSHTLRPRPIRRTGPPPPQHPSRPLIALIALIIIGTAIVILLAATGVLSQGSPASGTTPGAPAKAVPGSSTAPASSAPADAAPATTEPATSAPAPTTTPTAAPVRGGGGNEDAPGKGPRKSKPGKGKKKGQTGQITPPASAATPA